MLRDRVLLVALVGLLIGLGAVQPALPAHAQPPVCVELIGNGGFEDSSSWVFGGSGGTAGYSTDQVHSGSRVARLGIFEGPNLRSVMSVQQAVTIPANTAQVTLSFAYWGVSSASPGRTAQPSLDKQTVTLYEGTRLLAQVWSTLQNNSGWTTNTIDLSLYRGRTLTLVFGVENDGAGDRLGMYLDDVSLRACAPAASMSATATGVPPPATVTPTFPLIVTATDTPARRVVTPTPTYNPVLTVVATPTPAVTVVTPTPTSTDVLIVATDTPQLLPTPMPSVPATALPQPTLPPNSQCQEQIRNGDFESDPSVWTFGPTQRVGQILSIVQTHSGNLAAALGVQFNTSNVYTYSSVRQIVTIPADTQSATLTFWYFTQNDGSTPDLQEVLFLKQGWWYVVQPTVPGVQDILWQNRGTTSGYTQGIIQIDVNKYRGRTLDLYFNVLNDGSDGRTVMLLDDVSLKTCNSAAVLASEKGGAASANGANGNINTFAQQTQGKGTTVSSGGVVGTYTPGPGTVYPTGAVALPTVSLSSTSSVAASGLDLIQWLKTRSLLFWGVLALLLIVLYALFRIGQNIWTRLTSKPAVRKSQSQS